MIAADLLAVRRPPSNWSAIRPPAGYSLPPLALSSTRLCYLSTPEDLLLGGRSDDLPLIAGRPASSTQKESPRPATRTLLDAYWIPLKVSRPS